MFRVGQENQCYGMPIALQLMYGDCILEVYGGMKSIVEKYKKGKEKYFKTLLCPEVPLKLHY